MHKLIVAIIRHERLEKVLSALKKERIGFIYSDVKGFGKEAYITMETYTTVSGLRLYQKKRM
jgi:nitrogen regulatory protein PII